MLQMMKPTKFSKYPFLRTSMGIAPGNARKAKLYRPLDEFGLVDAESALSQRLARSIAVLQNEPFAKTAIAVNVCVYSSDVTKSCARKVTLRQHWLSVELHELVR